MLLDIDGSFSLFYVINRLIITEIGKMRLKFCHRFCSWTLALLAVPKFIVFLVCGVISFDLVKCEIYTALVDMEVFMETELIMLQKFNNFIADEKQKLHQLKRYN